MNMFKPTKAKDVDSYIAGLPKDRKEIITSLDSLIKKTVPKLKPHFAFNMLGYGSFTYKNNKKEILNWPVISLANQKNYISLYVCAIDGGQYVAEKHKLELGKVSVGKSCIRFKKLSDLNFEVLKKVLLIAAKKPGLVSVKNS